MRKIIPLAAAVFIGFWTCSSHAQILFFDNFTTTAQSDDVNAQYTGGRQTGTVGPLQYRQGNGSIAATITGTVANEAANGFKTQVGNAGAPNTLYVVGGNPAFSLGAVSPERNFTDIPGLGRYMSISLKLDPVTGSAGASGDWGGVSLGAADNSSFGAAGAGARGQSIASAAAHFGILFRDNGGYQAFDGGTQIGGLNNETYTTAPATITTHAIELRITGLTDGNPFDGVNDALISVYADGSATPFFSFTKTGGYTSNFLTLEGYGGGAGLSISDVDDFQVALVPEPGAWALTILAAGTVGLSRLRGKRRAVSR